MRTRSSTPWLNTTLVMFSSGISIPERAIIPLRVISRSLVSTYWVKAHFTKGRTTRYTMPIPMMMPVMTSAVVLSGHAHSWKTSAISTRPRMNQNIGMTSSRQWGRNSVMISSPSVSSFCGYPMSDIIGGTGRTEPARAVPAAGRGHPVSGVRPSPGIRGSEPALTAHNPKKGATNAENPEEAPAEAFALSGFPNRSALRRTDRLTSAEARGAADPSGSGASPKARSRTTPLGETRHPCE